MWQKKQKIAMERLKIKELIKWKEKDNRKPLIMRGARQVGKTWLVKEFGEKHYSNSVYINFEDSPELKDLFLKDFDITRIINTIEIFKNTKIQAESTLIIFDEVQIVERALTSLKYFFEKGPQYHIIAAGSLLGISMPHKTSFPVGKVDFIDINPLSFSEFLLAMGEKQLLESLKSKNWSILKIFKERLISHLRSYYYIGGMPEVVEHFSKNNDWEEARRLQGNILNSYEADFAKHAPKEIVARIKMVWQSIPMQLSKENKKFVYGALKPGARARDFEIAIQWLCDAGILKKLQRVSKPELPLIAFHSATVFKLYLNDVGLLSALCHLDVKSLISGNDIFLQYKGALTEQFVMQQLCNQDYDYTAYWTNERSTNEVDFVIQHQGNIIPIEVKAESNTRAKSFKFYCNKYKPSKAVRASLSDYKEEDWFTNMPLYNVEYIV